MDMSGEPATYGATPPPEPGDGTVVRDGRGVVWLAGRASSSGEPRTWRSTMNERRHWPHLLVHAPLTRLVPAGEESTPAEPVASAEPSPADQDGPRIIREAWEAVEQRDPDAVSGWSRSLADAIRAMRVPEPDDGVDWLTNVITKIRSERDEAREQLERVTAERDVATNAARVMQATALRREGRDAEAAQVESRARVASGDAPDRLPVEDRDMRDSDDPVTGPDSFTLYRRACERARVAERERDSARRWIERHRGTPAVRDAATRLLDSAEHKPTVGNVPGSLWHRLRAALDSTTDEDETASTTDESGD